MQEGFIEGKITKSYSHSFHIDDSSSEMKQEILNQAEKASSPNSHKSADKSPRETNLLKEKIAVKLENLKVVTQRSQGVDLQLSPYDKPSSARESRTSRVGNSLQVTPQRPQEEPLEQ